MKTMNEADNRTILIKIQRQIYSMVNKHFGGIFHDDAWQNVKRLRDAITEIDGVDDIDMWAGEYHNYLQTASPDKSPYRDYKTVVYTAFGNLSGYIRCCGAGTVEDPFSGYDIVISLYPEMNNESKRVNMKKTITESQLRNIIAESVKKVLSELDWKTYANAAKKRLQQYHDNPDKPELWDKYYELNKMANQRFDDDYVGDMKYDTLGDKLKGKHSPTFSSNFDLSKEDRMPYGAINGYNKSGDKLFSTDKGTYHSSNGITTPRRFFRDAEVADKYSKANDELWDYHNGNTESQLKNAIAEAVTASIKKLCEEYDPWMNSDASYIDGKYNINGEPVEINTRLSYVAIGDEYYFQGDEADNIIKTIAKFWADGNMNQEDAIAKWMNLYL